MCHRTVNCKELFILELGMNNSFKIASVLYLISSHAMVFAEDSGVSDGLGFVVKDPEKSLFGNASKVVQGVHSADWLVKVSAALFAITCFVSAGNLARQGEYGRAAGAVIGGIIAALGAYFVSMVQK